MAEGARPAGNRLQDVLGDPPQHQVAKRGDEARDRAAPRAQRLNRARRVSDPDHQVEKQQRLDLGQLRELASARLQVVERELARVTFERQRFGDRRQHPALGRIGRAAPG